MARVYSRRILAGTSFLGETITSDVVPDGSVMVVRDLTAVCADPAGGITPVWAILTPDSELIFFAFQDIATASSSAHLECRVVLNAGEALQVANPQAPEAYLTASGYLLGA